MKLTKKEFLEQWDKPQIDFTGYDLSGLDFKDFKFYREYPHHEETGLPAVEAIPIILKNAKLVGCNLSGANLNNVDLSGADLSGANLNNTQLSFAILQNANCTGATMQGANLNSANLINCCLNGADISDATFSHTQFGSTQFINTKGLNYCLSNTQRFGIMAGPFNMRFYNLDTKFLVPNGADIIIENTHSLKN